MKAEYFAITESDSSSVSERRERKAAEKKETLCWNCKNMGCSWMKNMMPVDGWTADETEISTKKDVRRRVLRSYFVHECPEFLK